MRNFLLTNAKYSGHIELLFNTTGQLCKVDFTTCELSQEQIILFLKHKVPIVVGDLKHLTGFTIVESDYEVTFDMFWKHYRKKVNRKRCEQLWPKITAIERVRAVHSLTGYYKCLDRTGRKEADPETFLKGEYWQTDWSTV